MKNIFTLFIFIFFTHINMLLAQTLTMGYRESAREPFIGKKGDDSGIYFDLYSAAAKKMNVNFKVIRLPKKRILRDLQAGEKIDFYPGFKFTKERAKYVYYMNNGLVGGWNIGISLYSLPLITNIHQLKGKRIVSALGSPDADILVNVKDIKISLVQGLDLKKTISLLRKKRHDFYIDYSNTIKYYLKTHKINDIKIHPNCCGNEKPMYFGFSRKSKNYKENLNPNYDDKSPLSINNFPTVISKDSLAYKLKDVLKQMKESGETQKIFDKYFD